tara:strand:- start:3390 stop:4979 length:1590 start_codon:yes stop_codon:yes gene_type:complete
LVGEDGTSEKGLSGDVVGSVDWATLGYGNPEINTLILKVLKRFHAQYMREESWRMMISREISNVVSNEGEEAYVYSYAKNQKQYNKILYRPSENPPILINELIKLERVPLKVMPSARKARSYENRDRGAFVAPEAGNMEAILSKPFIYFPHQTIFYGNMFIKDWPFQAVAPRDVAIIEWDKVPSMAATRYGELGVEWTTWGELVQRLGYGSQAKVWVALKAFIRNFPSWLKALIEAKYQHRCNTARKIFSKFLNARCAFIGYDILFPPELSQGLKECKIPTIAVQERTIHAFGWNQNVMMDHYIVPDRQCEKAWKKKPFSSIGRMYIGGHWRLEKETNPVLGMKDCVLVTDFHAEAISKYCTMINWDNYRRFYKELLEIGKRCQEYFFVIRTKEFSLDKVDPILFNQIQDCENVHLDLSQEIYRSYRLIRTCRLVFGRHTSLMDEAQALGVPVIVHENFCSSMPYLENISCEYASRFDISTNVDEAVEYIEKWMEGEFSGAIEPQPRVENLLKKIIKELPPRRLGLAMG